MTTTQATAADPTAAALERARALARAIGDSAAFRAFEAAQEALEADADLGFRGGPFETPRARRTGGCPHGAARPAAGGRWRDR